MAESPLSRAWSQALEYWQKHWRSWLPVYAALVVVGLVGMLPGLTIPPPGGLPPMPGVGGPLGGAFPHPYTPAQMAHLFSSLSGVGLFLLVAGTFVQAAMLGSLAEVSHGNVNHMTFTGFLATGWEYWSWIWRAVGFLIVLSLLLMVALAAIFAMGGFVVHSLAGVAPLVAILGVLLGVLVVMLVPVIYFWVLPTAFFFRPEGFWSALGRLVSWRGRYFWPMVGLTWLQVLVVIGATVVGAAFTAVLGRFAGGVVAVLIEQVLVLAFTSVAIFFVKDRSFGSAG